MHAQMLYILANRCVPCSFGFKYPVILHVAHRSRLNLDSCMLASVHSLQEEKKFYACIYHIYTHTHKHAFCTQMQICRRIGHQHGHSVLGTPRGGLPQKTMLCAWESRYVCMYACMHVYSACTYAHPHYVYAPMYMHMRFLCVYRSLHPCMRTHIHRLSMEIVINMKV
jgi:hypothetical protein